MITMNQTILITTSTFARYDETIASDIENNNLSYICNPFQRKLTENELLELVIQHDPIGIIAGVEPITKKVLKAAKNLKTISRAGIGVDSVDLTAAQELGITVRNTPDAPTQAVAELTLGLILTLLRKIHVADKNIREGKWYRPNGFLLSEKVIGIVGCGRIGKRLARLLKGFNCKAIGYDPVKIETDDLISVSIDQLLAESDIISLHLPYRKDTHHFIDAGKITMMKKGSFLINASRGGLVDENAVYSALLSGHLNGLGMDCFENEPYNGNLIKMENTVLTSHIGSYARESRIAMERHAVDNLLKELQNS